jgi:transcription factor SPN1
MSDSEDNSRAVSPQGSPAPQDHGTPSEPAVNTNDNSDDEENDRRDLDSELSEVDEAEFADFDPTTVALDDRPAVEIDEDVARTLKAGKRKRAEKDGEGAPKKPKEGKRDKLKKKRARPERAGTDGEDFDSGADGEILEGKRRPKPKSVRIEGERKERDRVKERRREEQRTQALDQENMTPEQRKAAMLDAAMDAALKNPNKRRRKKDEVVRLPANLYKLMAY